jgi:hypothetical protein
MSESYSSPAVTVIDIPEAELISIKFYYNFFQTDERTTGTTNDVLRWKDSIDVERMALLTATDSLYLETPRYVEIIWNPVTPAYAADASIYEAILSDNVDRIQTELEVGTSRFASLTLQDENVDGSIAEELATASQLRHLNTGSSALQTAISLMSQTSDNINVEALLDAGNLYDGTGYSVIDPVTGEAVESQTTSAGINSLSMQIDEKILGDLTSRCADLTFSPFYAGASYAQSDATAAQESARLDGASISVSDYEPSIDTLDVSIAEPLAALDESTPSNISAIVVGYVIEKSEYTSAAETIEHTPIIVTGYETSRYIDLETKYGSVYTYTIKTLAMFWLDTDVDGEIDSVAIISGRRGATRSVTCKEIVPPNPPRDVNFLWDYDNNCLYMAWEPPYAPQRDIKRYQLFRRESTSDPFELQAQLDFDDSDELSPRTENVPDSLNIEHDFPVSIWSDPDFDKESSYIYAVVALDAHDLTSGFSIQYSVSFDTTENRLSISKVSAAGAPKPYPNLNLIEDFFTSDAIKTSGYSKVRIYFDPEYLVIHDGSDTKVNTYHLRGWDETNSLNGQYKLQFINLDLQQAKTVTIKPYMNNFSYDTDEVPDGLDTTGTDYNPLSLLQEYLDNGMSWDFTTSS